MNPIPPEAVVLPETFFAQVEKLVYGGEGLARLADGRVVFLPNTVPGDQVSIESMVSQKGRWVATSFQVSTPSQQRALPPCDVFGLCGGCQWQHIALDTQRHWKEKIVEECLQRIAKISAPPMLPIISGTPWHYRNKVTWLIIPDTETTSQTHPGFRLGLSEQRSHQPTPVTRCHLIPDTMNVLKEALEKIALPIELFEQVEMRSNHQGQLLLQFICKQNTASSEEIHQRLQRNLVKQLTAMLAPVKDSVLSCCLKLEDTIRVLWGNAYLTETVSSPIKEGAPLSFQVSSDSFFQVNQDFAAYMVSIAEQWLPETYGHIWDLYAGVGLFTLPLAKKAAQLTAVEVNPSAIVDLQINCEGLYPEDPDHHDSEPSISIVEQDVEAFLREAEDRVEVAIVDPPRKGLTPGIIEQLDAHVTDILLYISCNPSTFARDVKQLVSLGWQLEKLQPLDMFPQTHHIEVMGLFRKVSEENTADAEA